MKKLVSAIFNITTFALILHPSNLLAQSGTLDQAFGENGMVTINTTEPYDLLVQPDLKIVIATNEELWRLNENGTLDYTFGDNGRITLEIENNYYINDISNATENKILITGGISGQTSGDLFLSRMNEDGTMDNNFGENGTMIYGYRPQTFEAGIKAIELSDGSILVGGNISNMHLYIDNFFPIFLMKFKSDGSVDTSFGEQGILFQDVNGSGIEANDMELQKDGKIMIAGNTLVESGWDFSFLRLNPDGTRDTTFGTNGSVILDMMLPNDSARYSSTEDWAYDIELQSDGKLVALGRKFYVTEQQFISWLDNMVYDTYELVITRLNHDGSQDLNFGENGIVEGAIHFSGRYHYYYSLQIDPDDRILVGHPSKFGNTDMDFVLSRYSKEGKRDESFGFRGSARINYPGSEAIKNIQLVDGYLYAAGSLDSYGDPDGEDGLRIAKYSTDGIPLSLDNEIENSKSIDIYPNPMKEGLNITFKSMPERAHVTIFDISGIKKIDQFFYQKQNIFIQIDILPPGLYYLHIDYDDHTYTGKVVK